jgi:hypothetical protein
MNVRWAAQVELSAAHAAFIVATGARCTDSKTEQRLMAGVTDINNRLLSASLDISVFWEQYLLEIFRDTEMQQACTVALMWSGCNEMQVDQTAKAITSRLSDARLGFLQRFPKLSEQLDLRSKPLRERWDTFGQGMLREVGRLIWGEPPSDWWPASVSAMMVQPMRGGDGGYDVDRNKIWMEAILTDVDPEVPEILRMVWLITRLAIDSHIREKSADQSLATAWSLVSVPLVLSAGKELELVRTKELPIRRAMELWQFGDAGAAETLSEWWRQFCGANQPLPAALRVLDQRLVDSGQRSD